MLHLRDGLKDGLGHPISYLRISVTERCDLARFYCRPSAGAPERRGSPAMSRNEVVRLVQVFTSLGIRRVRLTGGEPLLRRDLETIVAGICPEIEGQVHLTTNGLQLARRARSLREAGLLGVNINLDAADRGAFERLTGRNGFAKVLAGLEAARALGLKVKLNAVVLRGWNDDQIVPLARFAQREGLQVRFFEFMPQAGNGWDQERFLPVAEILRAIQEGLGADLEEEVAPGPAESPVRLFRIPGSAGKVGLASTLNSDFCGRCDRVRLTSRGQLMACRFGHHRVDLLGPLRQHATHDSLVRLIREALSEKPDSQALGRGAWQVGG
jgi:cyclic pyranopterin phosphate synthase